MADIGITLRNGRVQRGLTIDQAAHETRISPRFLEALEAEQFDELPAPVYVRGFLRSYANFLNLDAAPLLEQLAAASNRPIVGPDSFVGGPRGGRAAPPRERQSSNPFRPNRPDSAPLRSATPPPLPVMPAPAVGSFDDDDIEDEGWAPEVQPIEDADPGYASHRQDTGVHSDFEPAYGDEYRPRRVSGMLLEREGLDGGATSSRALIMVAGAVAVIIAVLGTAVLLTRGGGGSNVAAPAATPSATSRPGTVIALGSAPKGSATANASASPVGSTTPGATPSGTPADGAATPTQPGATSTPTTGSTPTPTRSATSVPTPTPVPPTPTPIPPTPVPVPSHPSSYALCTNGDCGDSPFTVVCPPDNDWYIDPKNNANPHGWPTHTVVRLSQASCP